MITRTSFTQITSEDKVTKQIQLNISTALDPVLATPLIDGRLISSLVIPANGNLTVSHGFGRAALGAHVVMASALVSTPIVNPALQTAPNGAIVLSFTTGAGATVSVWVF